ncbi:XK-related protein 6 isoform X1 [Hydra vulgaris]|uniref:XK-related protein 6 isoform X1 n=1 Tax=Hydra vulgaris TaxID=6087 RepID=UPI0032EA398F
MDQTETHVNEFSSSGKRDCLFNIFFSIVAVLTLWTDIITDALVAKQFFENKEWIQFGLATSFILFPSIILQLFSIKWDRKNKQVQTWFSIVLHISQLAAVKRCFLVIWYGQKAFYKNERSCIPLYDINIFYLKMLKLLHAFLESAPQLILQLFVLSKINRAFDFKKDWIIILSAVLSFISLALSVVAFIHNARQQNSKRELSICGLLFQLIYRLNMIISRIVAMFLFASGYTWGLFIVAFVHWLGMVTWLHYFMGIKDNQISKILFGYFYIFWYIKATNTKTKQHMVFYYTVFFVENVLMVVVLYPMRKSIFNLLEIGFIVIVCGTFIIGLLFMLIYYKFIYSDGKNISRWIYCNAFSKSETILTRIQFNTDQEPQVDSEVFLSCNEIISHKKLDPVSFIDEF